MHESSLNNAALRVVETHIPIPKLNLALLDLYGAINCNNAQIAHFHYIKEQTGR
jgi:hypothetical protein